MSCQYTPERIEQVKTFHGHFCPGLCIGIRAAEIASRRWPEAVDSELVAIVETDMCGVDAVQHLLGCTLGKGNLIHRDYGKMAFSFFHRPSNQGFRALLRPEARQGMDEEMGRLMAKAGGGQATEEELRRLEELRGKLERHFLSLDLEDMFDIRECEHPAPRPARILESLACEMCGEMTMESRTRRFSGKTLCIPCFDAVEQKR